MKSTFSTYRFNRILLLGILYSILIGQLIIASFHFTWHKDVRCIINLTDTSKEIYNVVIHVMYDLGIDDTWIRITPIEALATFERQGPEYDWTLYQVEIEIPASFGPLKADLLMPLLRTFEEMEDSGVQVIEAREEGDNTTRKLVARIGLKVLGIPNLQVCEVQMRQEGVLPFAAVSGKRGRLGIIIDDIGYGRVGVEGFDRLQCPLNFAILPHAPRALQEAEAAVKAGHLIMLHQPMEPIDPSIIMKEDAITVDMTDEEILALIDHNLSLIPGVEGINNHMGSMATADERIMRNVLSVVKERGLFFIDSRTSSNSIGFKLGEDMGVPVGKNSSFIDNESDVEYIKERIRYLARKALESGSLIGIGHDRPATFEALSQMIEELETAGVELIYVRELLEVIE